MKFDSATIAHSEWGGPELLEQIATEWVGLCAESPDDQPFYRPEWIVSFLRCFEPKTPVLLLQARTNGNLKGVLPLISRTIGFPLTIRKLQGAANVHSCRFDVVRGSGPEGDSAVSAIWSALKKVPGWDVVEIPRVPENGAAEQLLLLAKKDGYPTGRWSSNNTPYIVLCSGEIDASIFARSSHFRQNLRRWLRKARSKATVRLRKVTDFNIADLETFFEIEQSGWKGKEGSAIACKPEVKSFYLKVAKAAARAGYLSLYFLEFDDKPVAAHFGLNYGVRYFVPKVGYDESYANVGPGHIIVKLIIEELARDGVSEFDFLGPARRWKLEWATDTRPHSYCYIFQKGVRGRLLHFEKFTLTPSVRKLSRLPQFERLTKIFKGVQSKLWS